MQILWILYNINYLAVYGYHIDMTLSLHYGKAFQGDFMVPGYVLALFAL